MAFGKKENVKETENPAKKAVIFVCEKCGKRAACSGKELREELRHEAKERGLKREVRVVLTGCQAICPKGGVAVAISRADHTSGFYVAEGTAQESAADILQRL